MKKRSMLAVASLAAGVVTALVTPPSHAAVEGGLQGPGVLSQADKLGALLDAATQDGDADDARGEGPRVK
ncbi:hypothetical protein ACLGI4_27565 [Streptomyces sp. HMX112]|uniref:hypothetical protein n=1 Tax=Streptomyces sp. HMX112 TaxID=3390850 RepID=UPI003A80D5A4